jgi:hypothetical protein
MPAACALVVPLVSHTSVSVSKKAALVCLQAPLHPPVCGLHLRYNGAVQNMNITALLPGYEGQIILEAVSYVRVEAVACWAVSSAM